MLARLLLRRLPLWWRRGLGWLLPVSLAALGCILLEAQPLGAEPSKRHVLLLNSYHQGFRWTDELTAAVTSTLGSALPQVEFHIEYMDTKRLYTPQHLHTLRQLLALKYSERQPDIILASDDHALTFMLEVHAELFPKVPVVFCGVNDVTTALAVPRKYCTGIVERIDIKENVELVRMLLPRVRNIVSVSDGSSTGLVYGSCRADIRQC
jgi:ABC-type uncharacterized transport system substrate-binding protein